jgi:hypothetical protein
MMTSCASNMPVASKGDFLLPQAARDMDMAVMMAVFMDIFCIIFYFVCGVVQRFHFVGRCYGTGFWVPFFHFFSRCSATGSTGIR